jgi:DNA-directed RNA polymerase specialized sigma24 family protein
MRDEPTLTVTADPAETDPITTEENEAQSPALNAEMRPKRRKHALPPLPELSLELDYVLARVAHIKAAQVFKGRDPIPGFDFETLKDDIRGELFFQSEYIAKAENPQAYAYRVAENYIKELRKRAFIIPIPTEEKATGEEEAVTAYNRTETFGEGEEEEEEPEREYSYETSTPQFLTPAGEDEDLSDTNRLDQLTGITPFLQFAERQAWQSYNEIFKQQIQKLPLAQREIIVLYSFGYTIEQIAQQKGISKSRAEQRLAESKRAYLALIDAAQQGHLIPGPPKTRLRKLKAILLSLRLEAECDDGLKVPIVEARVRIWTHPRHSRARLCEHSLLPQLCPFCHPELCRGKPSKDGLKVFGIKYRIPPNDLSAPHRIWRFVKAKDAQAAISKYACNFSNSTLEAIEMPDCWNVDVWEEVRKQSGKLDFSFQFPSE